MLFIGIANISKIISILRKDVTYVKGIGWVDWGHARPEGPSMLIEDIKTRLNNNHLPSDTIKYSQTMKMRHIKATVSSSFVIDSTLHPFITELSYKIFNHVTCRFEEMQGGYPFNLIPCIVSSSQKEEDLNGNKISFYCASNRLSIEEFKKNTSELPFKSSIALYLNQLLNINPMAVSQSDVHKLEGYFDFYKNMEQCRDIKITCIQTKSIIDLFSIRINI